jgi:hypothetical protein
LTATAGRSLSFIDTRYCTGQGGSWKNYKDKESRKKGLPNLPFLILAPPTLVEQVVLECLRSLEPGSFDIIKITGAMGKHESVWSEADKRAEIPAHMRIYIASTTVSVGKI